MDISAVKKDFRKKKDIGVYMNALLTRKIHIPFNKISKNIKEILETLIKKEIEGKCTVEGFIKPNSTILKHILVEFYLLI